MSASLNKTFPSFNPVTNFIPISIYFLFFSICHPGNIHGCRWLPDLPRGCPHLPDGRGGPGGVRVVGFQREPLGHRPPVRQHSDGAVQHLRNHPRHRQSQSDRCHRPRQGQFAGGWGGWVGGWVGGEGVHRQPLGHHPPVRQHSDGAVQHLCNHPRHRQSLSDRCHRPRQGQFTRGVGWGVRGVQRESLGHRPQYASILMGLSNTFATIPGIVSPSLTGAIVHDKVSSQGGGVGGWVGGWGVRGFIVNHLDITPQYASILMGLSNTFATIPGIVSPSLTGAIVHDKVSSQGGWVGG